MSNMIDTARTNLANMVNWAFKSSDRAGTMMNRLVRWIDPTPRMRTEEQGGIPHKKLHERSAAALNAELAVNRLAEHNKGLMESRPKMMAKVFDLISVGQRFEARLLLEKYLGAHAAKGDSGEKDMAKASKESLAIDNYLQGSNPLRNNSKEAIALFQLELNRAMEHLRGTEHSEMTDRTSDNSWRKQYHKAEAKIEEMLKKDERLFAINHLSTAMLKQAKKGNTLVVRALFEKALRAQSEPGKQDKLYKDMGGFLQKPERLKNNSGDDIDAVLEDIGYAYDFVANGNPYPEFSDHVSEEVPPTSPDTKDSTL